MVISQPIREVIDDEAIPISLQGAKNIVTTGSVDSLPKTMASPCCVQASGEASLVFEDGNRAGNDNSSVGRGQVCVRCDARFHTFSALREHEREEHPEMFSCGVEHHLVSVTL